VTGVTRQPLLTGVASRFDGYHRHWLGVETMNPVGDLRREVLRLTRVQDRSVCFRIPQLAAFFHLPERRIREELASLAQKNLIHLSSWDGHQLRDLANWSDPEAFINSTADAGHVHAGAGPAPGV
jgi:hypothetical protein